MKRIISQVGYDTGAGTDDWVRLKFMNGAGDACTTDWLNDAGNNWENGRHRKRKNVEQRDNNAEGKA